jgi:hypothetical protein
VCGRSPALGSTGVNGRISGRRLPSAPDQFNREFVRRDHHRAVPEVRDAERERTSAWSGGGAVVLRYSTSARGALQ